MSILDPRVWLVALVAIAAAFGAGYFKGDRAGHKRGTDAVMAQWNAAELKRAEVARAAESESRKIEQRRQSLAMEAVNDARKREVALRHAAAGARSELDGLRGDLAASRASRDNVPSGACKTRDDRIAALEDVFEQCAGRYSGLAEKAGRHASDALTFDQAWPPP